MPGDIDSDFNQIGDNLVSQHQHRLVLLEEQKVREILTRQSKTINNTGKILDNFVAIITTGPRTIPCDERQHGIPAGRATWNQHPEPGHPPRRRCRAPPERGSAAHRRRRRLGRACARHPPSQQRQRLERPSGAGGSEDPQVRGRCGLTKAEQEVMVDDIIVVPGDGYPADQRTASNATSSPSVGGDSGIFRHIPNHLYCRLADDIHHIE